MYSTSLASILRRLAQETGQAFDPSVFENRVRIQKAIYLLQSTGYGPATRWDFSMFVRGPYSPSLTREYYGFEGLSIRPAAPASIPGRYLNPVVEATKKGVAFMECVATLHLVTRNNPGRSKKELLAQTALLKPELKRYLQEAWAFLQAHRLLRAST